MSDRPSEIKSTLLCEYLWRSRTSLWLWWLQTSNVGSDRRKSGTKPGRKVIWRWQLITNRLVTIVELWIIVEIEVKISIDLFPRCQSVCRRLDTSLILKPLLFFVCFSISHSHSYVRTEENFTSNFNSSSSPLHLYLYIFIFEFWVYFARCIYCTIYTRCVLMFSFESAVVQYLNRKWGESCGELCCIITNEWAHGWAIIQIKDLLYPFSVCSFVVFCFVLRFLLTLHLLEIRHDKLPTSEACFALT